MTKKILIISNGPIPIPEYTKIEGGGMRCWGIAKGLKSYGNDITVAVRDNYPIKNTKTHQGIQIINWSSSKLEKTVLEYDVVVVSYSMGSIASGLARSLPDNITLILDCYVPIYIEVSARNAENKEVEYKNYRRDLMHYNTSLLRGDYFLCANRPQQHMYTGVLSALGIINPYTYADKRILHVPFGIDKNTNQSTKEISNPYIQLGIDDDDFVLLWFGGLYPWFDINPLLRAVKGISKANKKFKFVIVGGKNPYNKNPDFLKRYRYAHKYAEDNNLLNDVIHFVDWVDFEKRKSWYSNANAIISINNPGGENTYSWRTRVMDYVWGGAPIITNGGDPLSEMLIDEQAAIRISLLEKAGLQNTLKDLIASDELRHAKKQIEKVQDRFYWEKVVAPINESIKEKPNPYLEEKSFAKNLDINIGPNSSQLTLQPNSSNRPPGLVRRGVRKIKKEGPTETLRVTINYLKIKLRGR